MIVVVLLSQPCAKKQCQSQEKTTITAITTVQQQWENANGNSMGFYGN